MPAFAEPKAESMYTFISIVYVFVCLFLILVVLLQSGKGGGLGSAFGGGGGTGQQIFGGAGAGNLLTRLTAVFAFAFMALSVWLAFLSTSGEQALDRAVREQTAAQEAAAEVELEEAEEAAAEAEEAAAEEAAAEEDVAADPRPRRIAAGQQAISTRSADRRVDIEAGEQHTFFGQRIDVRCVDSWTSSFRCLSQYALSAARRCPRIDRIRSAADFIRIQIVGVHEDDVGTRGTTVLA